MDILSGNKYPSNSLSNFAPHPFVFDGVLCNSMEGLLQSFKFKSPDMQKEVCKLVGFGAKRRGAPKKWQQSQTLYWEGQEYKRKSEDYQRLLDRAYNALYHNEKFKKALKASNKSVLRHSIGRTSPSETILTRREFCSRLTYLRDYGPLPRRATEYFKKDLDK